MANVGGKPATQLLNLNVTDTLFIQGNQVDQSTSAYINAALTSDELLTTTPESITYDTSTINRNITIDGDEFVISLDGVYQISIAFNFEKTSSGGTDTGFGWIRLNDVDVPNSAVGVLLTNQSSFFGANFLTAVGSVVAGDRVKIMVSSGSASGVQLSVETAQGGPQLPAALCSIIKVADR